MSYEISYSSEAYRMLASLDKSLQIRFLRKIMQLKDAPELGKPLSNVLKTRGALELENTALFTK